jgi:hypothetical protein
MSNKIAERSDSTTLETLRHTLKPQAMPQLVYWLRNSYYNDVGKIIRG